MNDVELYQQLLGLTAPWTVAAVTIDVGQQQVRVAVAAPPETRWPCPECGQLCPGYDHREERAWRHLDSCEFQTWLVACLPRCRCPQHGVLTVEAPWATPHSPFTLGFECFALRVLQATRVQAQAAPLLRLTPAQVHGIMERAVDRGVARRRAAGAAAPIPTPHLTLDEKSFGRGQQYLTVLGDGTHGRVWEVAATRTREATVDLLQYSLTPAQRATVAAVSLDMWAPYLEACAAVLPAVPVVHDRFHIAQALNDAVDQTRRAEHRRLRQARPVAPGQPGAGSPLTKTKYLWLRHPEALSADQQAQLAALRAQGLETARVWDCKEAFREFFAQPDGAAGKRFFQQWYERALAVGNRPLTAVAEQLQGHLSGVLSYLEQHVTNAQAEQLNSEIQAIKIAARGFRQFAGYRRAILFFLGGLDLCPHKGS
jgi:transposase